MSDTDTIDLGPTLTPDENKYFDTGGNSEIPTVEKPVGQGQDNQPGGESKDQKDTTVPHGAFHEERERRKKAENSLRELEKANAELRGKFSIIERLNQPQQEQTAPLTPETDIFGFAKQQGETLAKLQERLDKQDADKKTADDQAAMVTSYRNDAIQFEAKTPDYRAAYNHLLNSRAQELFLLGHSTPEALQQALMNEEMAIAQYAISEKKSPAEVIYALAKQRGYVKADDGKSGEPDAAAKLESIERGQNANKSLSSTGGNSGDDAMTAERLLKMPMDEFEAWCNKNPAKAKRLMGG